VGVWKSGGLEACMPTCRCAGMEVLRYSALEVSRQKGITYWISNNTKLNLRKGDMFLIHHALHHSLYYH
jgi:hypothetical protein